MSLQPSDTCETFRNKVDICGMFDRIAPRYDLLNHLLSFGQDFFWRRKVAKYLNSGRNGELEILDLATGTGDLLVSLFRENRNPAEMPGRTRYIGKYAGYLPRENKQSQTHRTYQLDAG